MKIRTVRGDISPEDAGVCLPHEHLLLNGYEVIGDPDYVYADVELAIREATVFAERGGGTIVDVTPEQIGRNPEGLRRVAEATGLNIVTAAGFYLPFTHPYPKLLERTSTNELAEQVIGEIENGCQGTDVRAGIIKVATRYAYLTPLEERLLRAVARAHRQTGATITTHAELYPGLGITQLNILEEEGVDPTHVIIGHAGTVIDGTYHRDVLRRGAYLQFDTVGHSKGVAPDDFVAQRIRELVDEGHAEQLLISMDICRRSHLRFFGGHGFGFLLDDFVPRLLKAGLTQTTVDTITRDNPSRAVAY